MKRIIGVLVVALTLLTTGTVLGASVTPTQILPEEIQNPTCADLYPNVDGLVEFKIETPQGQEDPSSQTDGDGTLSVSIVVPSATGTSEHSFDWTSNIEVLGVIVKDGTDGSNWYDYSPDGSTGDDNLTTPLDGRRGISHISFCYVPGDAGADEGSVTVEKTAEATFDRTHNWSIEKTADPTEVTLYHPLSGNGPSSADVDYEVVVTYDGFTDSNFMVTGTITIENDGDLAASITDIDDYLSSPDAVTLDCGDGFALPYELAVDETLTCDYEASPTDGTDGTNTVDVTGTFSDDSAIDESDTADYDFDEPENETNATVEVFDAYNGGDPVSLGTLDAADFDEDETETFNPESRTFTHPGGFDCTPYQVSNTATVESGETVLDSDTETVDVTLECAQRAGETATGQGPKWSLTRNAPATWFMYTTWADILDGGAKIIAGQFFEIGTITGTRNGTTSLTIDLNDGWYFANVTNNVKVNPMACGTNQNYKQPGQFSVKTTATADVSGQNKTVTGLPNQDCYGVHLDVYRLVFYFP